MGEVVAGVRRRRELVAPPRLACDRVPRHPAPVVLAPADRPLTVRRGPHPGCAAFGEADGLKSENLVARLRDDPEAPLDTLGKNGLNPKSLAGMLRDFGIHSSQYRWDDGTQTKGFKRDQFADSWRRYCPETSSRHLPVPAETATCISCRQPLSYDDGTHTHPTCTTDKGVRS